MEKFSLIFCVVLLPTLVQGSLIKHEGTEILVKDFIDAPIQQHGNKYSNRNIYTAVKEEIANMGDNSDKDVFINGIRSFIKAKRLRRAGLGIGNQSSIIVEDLHARGVKKITNAPIIQKIPLMPRAVLMTAATEATPATIPAATPASQPVHQQQPPATPTTPPLTTSATPTTTPATPRAPPATATTSSATTLATTPAIPITPPATTSPATTQATPPSTPSATPAPPTTPATATTLPVTTPTTQSAIPQATTSTTPPTPPATTSPATTQATPPTTPQATPLTAAAATTSLPTIKWPKIIFCKLFLFLCKSNGKGGWLFNR